MNWEVIGIVSQVASAFAIVVTLIYLAAQNRLANVAAASDTTIKGTELASHWRSMVVTDASLADALARANTVENELDLFKLDSCYHFIVSIRL